MTRDGHNSINLAELRSRLAEQGGKTYWRSLDQLADTPEFRDYLEREFPVGAAEWHDPVGRRNFLKLMAASLALAGVTGCRNEPEEAIVPYVRAPVELTPGKPLYYSTAMTLGGYALGVRAESHMGRPTKIEGNPLHPETRGATNAFAQASILSLYDPDRSQTVRFRGGISTWDRFLSAIRTELERQATRRGSGVRILTETITSPTLASQIERLIERYPQAKWHQYEPLARDNVREGATRAFGESVDTVYRFDQADIVLSLDADFLLTMPGSLAYAREFIDRRRVAAGIKSMNRLYIVESTPTITGAIADHRLPLCSSQVEAVARELASRLGVVGVAAPSGESPVPQRWLDALVGDLQESRGRSIVVAGEGQSPIVHAIAHGLNEALGNVGSSVRYIETVSTQTATGLGSLEELVSDMAAERAQLLVMLGGNPVYNAPAEFGFASRLDRVAMRVHLSDYFDETSRLCHWHLPAAHYLESWGDARAYDGTVSLQQPLIAPLYGSRTPLEVIAAMLGEADRSPMEIVQSRWQEAESDFASRWRQALHDGILENTAAREVQPRFALEDDEPSGPADQSSLEVVFRPDPTIWDGRFSNNGWLQELPKPLTKITWDNPALISPATAERLQLANGDVVTISKELDVPVWITPGHADDCVTLFLGYGRRHVGNIGNGLGYNAYALRPAQSTWFARGFTLEKTDRKHALVTTQDHHSMEGRDIVKVGNFADIEDKFPRDKRHNDEFVSLYPEYNYEKYEEHPELPRYAWGMAIDQTACIGCNACVVACQAENNIPIVGKDQVAVGREMHWLRIDRYYQGDLDNPDAYFQPMLCMHCEKAPCEVVCPVAATVHDHEGLNTMVYNRCVGTRYCSNNCPYKVRRFNYLEYANQETPVLKLLRNPDVTVRTRGVMEKCTYCVQRISSARIEAKKENRAIQDGEVVTACASACPTRAIIFGDLNNKQSEVVKFKDSPLNYGLLADLNTQPRTTYLARIRNPNPSLVDWQPEKDSPPPAADPEATT